jgi:ribosome production factor 1
MNPSKYIEEFLAEMVELLPNSEYRKRGKCPVKEMCDAAVKRGFTNLLIFTEDNTKKNVVQKEAPVTGLWVVKLPYGPTARFKLTTLVMPKKIRGHGTPTGHRPELILNNFNTRLGHRMGRMLACLFPYDPQFKGRQVAALHLHRAAAWMRGVAAWTRGVAAWTRGVAAWTRGVAAWTRGVAASARTGSLRGHAARHSLT